MNDTYKPNITGDITIYEVGSKEKKKVHNRVVGSAQGIIAKLLGGDNQYKLSHVGFIYAASDATPMPDPVAVDTFEELDAALDVADKGNMIIVPLAANSIYATDSNHTNHNIVTKQAVSDQNKSRHWDDHYAEDPDGNTYRQVVLLSEVYDIGSSVPRYELFSYADISPTPVVEGKELGLDWAITCNEGI